MTTVYEKWRVEVSLDDDYAGVKHSTFRIPERGILDATMADILPEGVEGHHILDVHLTYLDSEMA